ncbi:hypothetical protein Y1Q_0014870 [Alligator mississippiensis]|uniref:Uncharacterized protein n=1 Tax=Alligator mississippiensis TaxID=8496 RepID=A0A151MRL1_ALLMI|nr:hypothetical protein Y1Q_0014870 [Alligator mississippiensis]
MATTETCPATTEPRPPALTDTFLKVPRSRGLADFRGGASGVNKSPVCSARSASRELEEPSVPKVGLRARRGHFGIKQTVLGLT